jgi:hypothetical protein
MERRTLIACATLSGVALTGTGLAQAADDARALIDRFAATLSAHDIAAFSKLFADDYVNHQRSAAASGPAAGKSPKQATIDFSRLGSPHS